MFVHNKLDKSNLQIDIHICCIHIHSFICIFRCIFIKRTYYSMFVSSVEFFFFLRPLSFVKVKVHKMPEEKIDSIT